MSDDDPVQRPHRGAWLYHDDDCRCTWGGDSYCNRDGHTWTCCGACKEHSDCTEPAMHPTYWQHPLHGRTVAGWNGVWPRYKSNAEIRALAPELFGAD
ncbi:MAG: hypothetical protein H6738_24830 [Alphaproteobacteria bacterium]|nr:hypothetical protein [Alphaproteobacteria bacterium]MCB9700036.1 hypothetical protein [Alphaproteobacteria bacterium]